MKIKCPNSECQREVTSFPYMPVQVGGSLQIRYKAVSVYCPHCHTSLGLLADPVAFADAVADSVARRLRGN